MRTLGEVGEFGLLAELERRDLAQGIEHDAAVVDGLVVTQDALVEGVHFRFDLLGWRELGARAAAVNISDLAASGAGPLALLVSLGLPPETELEDVFELYAGLNERRVPIRGGDTTRADHVLLSVTALGRSDRVPGRAFVPPPQAAPPSTTMTASTAGHATRLGTDSLRSGDHPRATPDSLLAPAPARQRRATARRPFGPGEQQIAG